MSRVLTLVSLLSVAVSGWMLVMYFVLRHPGFAWRAGAAAAICAGSAALAAGAWRMGTGIRICLMIWALGLAAFGVWALVTNASAPDADGWTDIAGALFVLQGVLAIATITFSGRPAMHAS